MKKIDTPLISCLCVTKNKPSQLQRAIDCFLYQTYANTELIIVFEDNDPATKEMLASVTDKRIKCFEVPATPKMSLGALRNFSIAKADGDYFCQWDDDDWYHEARLQVQLDTLLKNHKPACYMVFWLIYDMLNNRSYFSMGPWAGSLLCQKSLVTDQLKYPDLGRHEDIVFLKALIRQKHVFPVVMPSLYIYAYHGKNTFGESHFNDLFSASQPLPHHVTELFRRIFEKQICYREASRLLLTEDILCPINYFYFNNEADEVNIAGPEVSALAASGIEALS